MLNIKEKRIKRVRAKISGTPNLPRLSVFRSNKHISAQIIDDTTGVTMAAASDLKSTEKVTGIAKATQVGAKLAEIAKQKKINQVIFDRHGYRYHGRVKALAEGARSGGLKI